MKQFKMKFVGPIGKTSFRIHVLSSYLIQAIFAFCIFQFMNKFSFSLLELKTFYYFLFIIILNILLLWFVFDVDKYRARFKDIFPDQNLHPFLYILIGMMPIAFIICSVFLCFKESADFSNSKNVFKLRYVLVTLFVLQLLQVGITNFSFWTAGPSIYLTVDTAHDALNIIQLKEKAIFKENYNVFDEYPVSSDKLSSTEIVLLVSVNAALIIKEKNRTIASGTNKDEAAIKTALHLLNVCYLSLLKSESRIFQFRDYSPVHWIHPSGPMEILLLSMIEQQILLKFNKVIVKQNVEILKNIEKKNDKLSGQQREIYLKKISELKKKFEVTKTFIALNQTDY